MKVEFKVTADLDTGELRITCPEVFEFTNSGWGPVIRTNYPEEFKQSIKKLLYKPIRSRFMTMAKTVVKELERAEISEEEQE